jgi:hypothetical protein
MTTTSENAGHDVAEAPLGSGDHVQVTLVRARSAIRAARAGSPASRTVLALHAELRASITAYVRHLHADGLPAERVLVRVKTAVREATPPELDPSEARDLMEHAVRWSIAAYYDAA